MLFHFYLEIEHVRYVMTEEQTTYQDFVKEFDSKHPHSVNPDGTHPLHSTWVLWSHPPASVCDRWDIDSYVLHGKVSTVEDFWNIFNGMKSLVNPDMWFFMRENIPPIWEHNINKAGGRYKFKVTGNQVDNTFLNLCVHLVTENICLDGRDSIFISGVSVSPKQKDLSTVSIWDIDSSVNDSKKFASNIKGIDFETGLYDVHVGSKSRPNHGHHGHGRGRGRGGRGGHGGNRGRQNYTANRTRRRRYED